MIRPGRFGLATASVAGLVVSVLTATAGPLAGGLAVFGFVLLVAGVLTARVRVLTTGGAVLVAAVVAGGVIGLSRPGLLVAAGCTALAYDGADRAVTLRATCRPDTVTRDVEIVGTAVTGTVVLVAGGAVSLFDDVVTTGSPIAVVALLVGAVLVVGGTLSRGEQANP